MSPPRTPRRCSIKGCPSVSGRQQHRGVTFNQLPLNKIIRQHWLTNCGISDTRSIVRKLLVCSRHFRRADFQPVKNNKYLLKEGALPTIFPWGTLQYVEPTPHTVIETGQRFINEDNDKQGEIDQQFLGIKVSSRESNVDGTVTNQPNVSSFPVVTASQFSLGTRIEAQGLDGIWYSAKVMEVDSEEKEVFVQFEKNIKSEEPATVEWMEWISTNSSRFRRFEEPVASPVATYMPGDKCLAKWTDTRKFPAVVQKILENNYYEVRFYDGFVKVVKARNMSKIKTVNSVKTSKTATYAAVSKTNPHPPIPKVDLTKLKLEPVPKDGEWCCNWVNGIPVGVESYIECRDGYKRPTLIVEDWRLPPGWTKHAYPRPDDITKWDVVLIGPTKKRFRSRSDVKVHFEEKGEVYDLDIYDFSIHKRRAKNLGLYIFTNGYEEELKNRKFLTANEQEVQLLNKLFCCSELGCDKKFRKESQLQIHMKHYHDESADPLGSCSDISDLAYQNIALSSSIDESIVKDEIPDAGPIPVAIYRTPNFEHSEQVNKFLISYVDSNYD